MEAFLFLIIFFTLKHFLADWVLQTSEIAQKKGKEIKFLLIHSLHHSLLTLLAVVFGFEWSRVVLIAAAEFILHSLIDYLKASEKLLGKFKYPSKPYFIFLGLDQTLHQLSYILFSSILAN